MACVKCEPFGGLWQETPAGLRRCDCAEGDRLAGLEAQRESPVPKAPVISSKAAGVFVEMLGAIPFFPAPGGARLAIAEELRSIVEDDTTALWLVQRMIRLYSRWPGPREMRLVYCAKHLPLDGLIESSISDFYPEGIPAEVEEKPIALPPARTRQISAAPSVQAAVSDLAEAKDITPAPPAKRRDIPCLPPGVSPIGQAEIDAAVAELRRRKAEEGLDAESEK